MKYQEAKQELEEIIESIESGEVDLDTLSAKVKRAFELITFCKNKLRETQEHVDNILQTFQINEGKTEGKSE